MIRRISSFENAYSELMESSVSLEIKDGSCFYFTYKRKGGPIRIKSVSMSQYKSDLERSNHAMKVSVDSIFYEGVINCFIENEVLCLDQTIPFKTQISELEKLKRYFYITYREICYNGELSFSDKISNFLNGRRVTNSKNLTGDKKTSAVLTGIKMQLPKLDIELRKYIEGRIDYIYSKPEEKLKAYVDLTKPIQEVNILNVSDQLEALNQQIPILVKASSYIKGLQRTNKPNVFDGINGVDEETVKTLSAQIEKEIEREYSIHCTRVRQNAIAEFEGREHDKLEDLAEDFKGQIWATCRLIRDYYTQNRATFDLIYGTENDVNIIVARINSIYSFYTTINPYTKQIANYNDSIRKAIDNRENPEEIVAEYNNFLKNALKESEEFAFDSIISGWNNGVNKVIFGTNPIFTEIGKEVEKYSKLIKAYKENDLHKPRTYREDRDQRRRNVLEQQAVNQNVLGFNQEFETIISKIRTTYYSKQNENSMIRTDKDNIYRGLLNELKGLISKVENILAYNQRQEAVTYLLQGRFDFRIENDSNYNSLVEKVEDANNKLESLEKYTLITDLFNKDIIEQSYNNSKSKYNAILERIKVFYRTNADPNEYKAIIEDLESLTNDINTICQNEAILLGYSDALSSQKKKLS